MRRVITVAALALVLLIALSSCSKKDQEQPKKRIAGIIFQDDQFFQLVVVGMRDAARKNGAELLEGNSTNDLNEEARLIDRYIADRVDAIVISPLNAKASVGPLKRAHQKGITIVTYNTALESDVPICHVESDQVDIGASTGRLAREYAEKKLGGRAKVAVIAFQSQSPEQSSMRTRGFKQEITKLPGVKIVAEQDAWLLEQAVKKVRDILTANPDLNMVWAANEGSTVGAVQAVKNAGKVGKVVAFGTDIGERVEDCLMDRENILQAVTGQQPFEIGSMAVEAAVKSIQGEIVERKVLLPGYVLTREKASKARQFKSRMKELGN